MIRPLYILNTILSIISFSVIIFLIVILVEIGNIPNPSSPGQTIIISFLVVIFFVALISILVAASYDKWATMGSFIVSLGVGSFLFYPLITIDQLPPSPQKTLISQLLITGISFFYFVGIVYLGETIYLISTQKS